MKKRFTEEQIIGALLDCRFMDGTRGHQWGCLLGNHFALMG
ncbi:hypothetical protein [Chromobacterium subtsugae]|nr:hypothetical protein [Chromobacterium subtsugae]